MLELEEGLGGEVGGDSGGHLGGVNTSGLVDLGADSGGGDGVLHQLGGGAQGPNPSRPELKVEPDGVMAAEGSFTPSTKAFVERCSIELADAHKLRRLIVATRPRSPKS